MVRSEAHGDLILRTLLINIINSFRLRKTDSSVVDEHVRRTHDKREFVEDSHYGTETNITVPNIRQLKQQTAE